MNKYGTGCFVLGEDLLEAITIEAKRRRCSKSDVVREALLEHFTTSNSVRIHDLELRNKEYAKE